MKLAIVAPPHPVEVPPLAALLGVRELPPQHMILAFPSLDTRIDLRALECEALLLRYGPQIEAEKFLNDRSAGTWALQSKEARRFVQWLAGEGRDFPITPIDVVRFLSGLAERGLTHSSVSIAMYGVESLCRAVGVCEHVTKHYLVKKTMAGIARERGVRPSHRKDALLPDDVRRALPYFEELARTKPMLSALELAVVTWGISTAMRGDEISKARIEQLASGRNGRLRYQMTIGKTLQHAGDEELVSITRAVDERICPVQSYLRYAEMARLDAPGPLFRRVAHDGSTSLRSALTPQEISAIVKRVASAAGMDSRRVSAHSLRIGSANAARLAGFSRDQIKSITRHRDDRILDGYMRQTNADAATDLTGRMFQ